MISLPGAPWGCTGSLDVQGYVEMKSPTSSQRGGSTEKFIAPEPSLGDLGRISVIRINAGWITGGWQGGVVFVVHRDSLEN